MTRTPIGENEVECMPEWVQLHKIQTQKGSNERWFILTRTHSVNIFGEIPFIKPRDDT